jgi:dihydroorotate dehydrogenase
MVFHGPGLVKTIKLGLTAEAKKAGVARIGDLVGRDATAIARGEDF